MNGSLSLLLFPAAFLTQTICLDDTTVKFEIWDTAGQERYHSLAPMYYRGAQAAIVVYDITNTVGCTCQERWTLSYWHVHKSLGQHLVVVVFMLFVLQQPGCYDVLILAIV